jgi:hypothetical protein
MAKDEQIIEEIDISVPEAGGQEESATGEELLLNAAADTTSEPTAAVNRARALIEAGVPADTVLEAKTGATALHVAAARGHPEMVHYLLTIEAVSSDLDLESTSGARRSLQIRARTALFCLVVYLFIRFGLVCVSRSVPRSNPFQSLS